jgi:hypothetical protein
MTNPLWREAEDEIKEECLAATVAHMIEGKTLVLLQVNCRSVYSKAYDFGNLIDTYNRDVMCTESWLSEEVMNAGVFMANYTTFKRDGRSRGEGVFICVKNNITWAEIWFDELHEMKAIEVKGGEPKKKRKS